MSLMNLPASELLAKLRSGGCSSREACTEALQRIERDDPALHAFLAVDPDRPLAQADAIDAKRSRGEVLGPLAGIPIAIKDVLCETGQKTTCGSRMLVQFISPYDAHVITRLKQADAVLLGRTNMDEFAMGSSSENSAYGVTRNPWDLARTPGGSSSGSAAAVAARMSPLAIGSDTGGSIRQPAGLCGIVGMKPTYGRVSRYGLVAYASSLDQIGPFASDVGGAAALLEAISGHDPRDSTSLNEPTEAYSELVEQPLSRLTLGVVPAHFAAGLDPEIATAVRAAIDVYRGLGATIREIELPHAEHSIAVYYLIAPAEASSNLSRYDGVHYGHRSTDFRSLPEMYAASRGEAFGPEVKRRIMLGTYALSSGYYDQYYVKALRVRRLIRQDYDAAFAGVDAILGPVTPTPAFKLGEKVNDPLAMYLSDIYTIGANLAGIPAIALPCGFTTSGLPIGFQLQGPPLAEARLLQAARMYERATDWHHRRPSSSHQ